jgi:hypothetical protein
LERSPLRRLPLVLVVVLVALVVLLVLLVLSRSGKWMI